MTDTSNHGNIKMLPIITRSFDPIKGVSCKKIGLTSITNERSETIVEEILKIANDFQIVDKIISFSADNTNLNFGGLNRTSDGNIWRILEKKLNRKLVGAGCKAHVMHNATCKACLMLDIDVENALYKIHKYFMIHTKRNENFKALCEESDVLHKPTLSHLKTRFLSLSPALNRVLELYAPLKQYFASLDKCPPVIQKFFSCKSTRFWLCFLNNQIKVINDVILRLEHSQIAGFEINAILQTFKSKLINRGDHIYFHENE